MRGRLDREGGSDKETCMHAPQGGGVGLPEREGWPMRDGENIEREGERGYCREHQEIERIGERAV